MQDARFEDAGEQPLRLRAETVEDLRILSALLQDAIFTPADVKWSAKGRRLDILLNRFRWEDSPVAERAKRPFERVRAVLTVWDVQSLAAQGVSKQQSDLVLSLLSLDFTAGEDGTGQLELVLSGDGGLRAQVECLNLQLTDVTRPYRAPSGQRPQHD